MGFTTGKPVVTQIDGYTEEEANARIFARDNIIINGGMKVWQRGESFTISNNQVYTADRFKAFSESAGTGIDVTRTVGHTGRNDALRLEISTASDLTATTNEYIGLSYTAELQDSDYIPFGGANEYFSVSARVRSNVTGTFEMNIEVNNTNSGELDTRVIYNDTYTISTPDSWQYVTFKIPKNTIYDWYSTALPNGAGVGITFPLDVTPDRVTATEKTWLDPTVEYRNFVMSSNTTAFGNTLGNYFEITELKLEDGDEATPFIHESYKDTLMKCYRYCQVVDGYDVLAGTAWPLTTNSAYLFCMFPQITPMRSGSLDATVSRWRTRYCSTDDGGGEGVVRNVNAVSIRYTRMSDGSFNIFTLLIQDLSATFSKSGYAAYDARVEAEL